jgi:glyoxylase I family protein
MSRAHITDLHHVSFLVANLDRALAFYCGVLGLETDAARPDLGYPGVWLPVGARAIHLLQLPSPDPVAGRPAHAGRDRHAAFSVDDLDALMVALKAAQVAYTPSRSGRRALFCRDPDGNGLEFVMADGEA